MRIRSVLLLPSVVIFAGCATATPTFTPSGKQGFTLDCSSEFMTWGECYTKAGELCGAKGYDILEKIGEKTSSISGSQLGVYGSTSATRTMLIVCKE